jgi:2-oxoglutarate dehydrogenase E1 component
LSSDPSSQPTPESIALLASSDYVEQMYEQWEQDPSSMSEEWRLFFAGFDLAARPTGTVASERAADQQPHLRLP